MWITWSIQSEPFACDDAAGPSLVSHLNRSGLSKERAMDWRENYGYPDEIGRQAPC